MKTKSFLKTLAAMLFAAMTVTSCSQSGGHELDGDWAPMEWDSQVKTELDGTITVPASGGTYVFTCTNYAAPWLAEIKENGVIYRPGFIVGGDMTTVECPENTIFNLKSECSTVSASKRDITVTIAPNAGEISRKIQVSVTAGDIFDTFSFIQSVK